MASGYTSPGYAGVQAMEAHIAQRELKQRQDMLDRFAMQQKQEEMQMRREEGQARREDLLDRANERDRATFEKRVSGMLPGDQPDPELTAKDLKFGTGFFTAPQAEVPGPTETGAPSMQPSGPAVYIGNREDRQAQAKRGQVEAITQRLTTLNPESPEYRQALIEYEMLSGRSIPAGMLKPAGEDTVQTLRQDPRKGVVERLVNGKWVPVTGDTPKGAHWMTTPEEKADDAPLQLSSLGLDTAAINYRKTGQLPPMGMGPAGAKIRTAVINRAGDYDPDTNTFTATVPGDIAASKANIAADQAALTQLTKNDAAVKAFSTAAKKNGDLFEKILDKVPDTGVSFVNRPMRTLATMFGSEEMSAFNTLRLSLQTEFSRIINNPNLSGVLAESARKELEQILDPGATVGQIRRSFKTLTLEAGNRESGIEEEIKTIKGRIKGGPASAPAKTMTADEYLEKYLPKK